MLHNAMGVGEEYGFVQINVLRCTVQRCKSYEEVGGCQISRKKALRNT